MRHALILCCFGSLLAIAAGSAHALGFGKTQSPTTIGEPLDFSAVVRLAADESLEPGCVRAEVLAGENPIAAEQVRIVLQRTNDPAERLVRVTTRRAIGEPVVSVTVALGCGAAISRKFVAFLDPPLVALARARSDEQSIEATRGDASPAAPVVTAIDAGVERRAAVRPAPHPRARPVVRRRAAAAAHASTTAIAETAAGTPRASGAATRRAHVAAVVPRVDGPRLRLESTLSGATAAKAAASAVVPAAPVLAASALLAPDATPAPAAALEAIQSQLAVERARNQRLEAALAQLRSEAAAQQKRVHELQAWMQQAEAGRGADRVVFVLAGLCALLAVGIGLLWRGLPSRASTGRWWDLTQQPAAAGTTAANAAGEDGGHARSPVRGPNERWGFPTSSGEPETAPAALAAPPMGSSIGGLEVTTVIDHAWLARMAAGEEPEAMPTESPRTPASRPASIDALIDLDQQVDFFLVLDQEDAAIELLSRHLEGSDLASPLPLLRLLEIHRRRGDAAAFARVARSFEQRFGTVPVAWEAAAGHDRGLAAHPAILGRLQSLWPMPQEAMKVLEASLLQRRPADDDFDVTAARELLFLYGIARDLAETAAPDGVDILLPIETGQVVDLPLPELSAFGPTHATATQPVPLDFDLSLPALLDDASELRQAV